MTYLQKFFSEKDLAPVTWTIDSPDGTANIISSEAIIEMIHGTEGAERTQIEDTIRKIDFHNGDVNHFLRFLAGEFVKINGDMF